MNENIPPATNNPTSKPKRSGCLLYGCITCVVLAFLVVVGGLLTFRYMVSRFVDTYTDSKPMELPSVNMPQEDLDRLKSRVSEFDKSLRAGNKPTPIVLTARELNALLASAPQVKGMNLSGRFYIALDGDRALAQFSLPLDNVNFPTIKTQGRYLNGVGAFGAAVTNGTVELTVRTVEAKGKPVPEFMKAYVQALADNAAMQVNTDANNTAALNQIENVEIKDSTVIIHPKQ